MSNLPIPSPMPMWSRTITPVKANMNDFSTFSICLPPGCDAACKYCVARMTGLDSFDKTTKLSPRNFEKAVRMAELARINTVLFTGKGEPMLYQDRIDEMLKIMGHRFPLIVLQTNGLRIYWNRNDSRMKTCLHDWWDMGLTHISLSIVHWLSYKNEEIICRGGDVHYDLKGLVNYLSDFGFMVRLNVTMCQGYIDSLDSVLEMEAYASDIGAEITFRPVAKPDVPEDSEIADWVSNHQIPQEIVDEIVTYHHNNYRLLYEFDFGGLWFDIDGQNVVLSNCLTGYEAGKPVRQLIYFADNSLGFDWQSKAAMLLPAVK